jgi:DNA-binding transcriptional ArsR family regulator
MGREMYNMSVMNVYEVISHPIRRAMLEQLSGGPAAANELGRGFRVSQPAVARHLRVLREAGLVETLDAPDDARVRLYRVRPEPLREVDLWLKEFWQSTLAAFAVYAEEQA